MNEDELSPREHAEMRDLVLAGTQRIRPRGVHRPQLVAAVLALVLVGAVAGGAVTSAALFGSSTDVGPVASPSSTPSAPLPSPSTPSPSVTPSPTLPAVPREGVVSFGGSCANALTEEEVDAFRGIGMTRSDYSWESGAKEVLGGIDCVWVSDEVYLGATVHVYAYPVTSVPSSVRDAAVTGCEPIEWDDSLVECSTAGVVDGTWLLVRAVGPNDQISAPGVDALYAGAASRLSAYPGAAQATRTAAWWPLPDCAAIVVGTDPAVYGYERVGEFDDGWSGEAVSDRPDWIPTLAGASRTCGLHFTSGSGDAVTGEVITVEFVPGGAPSYSTAVAAGGGESVVVAGAADAVQAPGLDRYEGSWAPLVVTDGVNLLILSPNGPVETEDLARLAGAVLALM